jgi:hypothetical protein
MQQGALLRKHSIDVAVLCCLLCVSFFAASSLYPSNYLEMDGSWYAYTDVYADTYGVGVNVLTVILPASYGYYDQARVDTTFIVPNGTQWPLNGTGFPYAIAEMHHSNLLGIWQATSEHYLSQGSNWIHVGTTSDTLELVSINYFYSNPSTIPPSGASTLYWSTNGASSISINGTSVPATGSMVVNPTSSTIYTLNVSNSLSSAQAKTGVRTTNEPLNANYYKYSVRHEKGISPFFPYTQVAQESVNSANGNLHFKIPLLSRPGRNGMGIDLALAYNSKIWDFFVQGSTLYATLPEYDSWVGLGWTLTMGRMIDDSANGYYYFTSSDGSNHTFKNYGNAWRSTDSTYMVYDPATRKLTLNGGASLQFDYQDTIRAYMRYATKIQDANGNYLQFPAEFKRAIELYPLLEH